MIFTNLIRRQCGGAEAVFDGIYSTPTTTFLTLSLSDPLDSFGADDPKAERVKSLTTNDDRGGESTNHSTEDISVMM